MQKVSFDFQDKIIIVIYEMFIGCEIKLSVWLNPKRTYMC